MRFLMQVMLLAAMGAAGVVNGQAGADSSAYVAVINQLAGDVIYEAAGAAPVAKARAFMRARHGDRYFIPAGASLRILYLSNARQETWRGPATLRVVGVGSSEAISGRPFEVATLPVAVSQKMSHLPDMVQGARLGGVTVRGGGGGGRPPGSVPAEVLEAQAMYKVLRSQSRTDDVTPELYLLSVLQEFGYSDEMGPVADEIFRRQPNSPDARELALWAKSRANAAR
jgi:hypothetical protein